jgi:DNA repair protein RadC
MLSTAKEVVKFFPYRDWKSEVVGVFFLSSDLCLLGSEYFHSSPSNPDRVPLSSRQIISIARAKGATQVVLVHNHTDGFVYPSKEDLHLRDTLKRALLTSGMDLTGFAIVSGGLTEDYA